MKRTIQRILSLALAAFLPLGALGVVPPLMAAAAVELNSSHTSIDFGAVTEGYASAPAEQTITVEKQSPGDSVYDLAVKLQGPGKDSFILTSVDCPMTGPLDFSASVTVRPEMGLEPGTYSAMVVFTWDDYMGGTPSFSVPIKFTVEAQIFTVKFNSNGGSAVADQTIARGGKVIRPEDPTRAFHTFWGWYKDPEFTEFWSFWEDMVTSDITLHARWNSVTSTRVPSSDSDRDSGMGPGTFTSADDLVRHLAGTNASSTLTVDAAFVRLWMDMWKAGSMPCFRVQNNGQILVTEDGWKELDALQKREQELKEQILQTLAPLWPHLSEDELEWLLEFIKETDFQALIDKTSAPDYSSPGLWSGWGGQKMDSKDKWRSLWAEELELLAYSWRSKNLTPATLLEKFIIWPKDKADVLPRLRSEYPYNDDFGLIELIPRFQQAWQYDKKKEIENMLQKLAEGYTIKNGEWVDPPQYSDYVEFDMSDQDAAIKAAVDELIRREQLWDNSVTAVEVIAWTTEKKEWSLSDWKDPEFWGPNGPLFETVNDLGMFDPGGGIDIYNLLTPGDEYYLLPENTPIWVNHMLVTFALIFELTGSPVHVRVTVLEPGKMEGDVWVSGDNQGAIVDSRKAFFEKWYANKLQIVHLDQAGSFGQSVEVAAKVDLTGMDTDDLYFYSYDKESNRYKQIAEPNYRIDKSGYLHFTTEYGGDIVICEGKLVKK